MNAAGIVLILAGVWVVAQATRGNALYRLKLLDTPMGPKDLTGVQ